jgi:hypothetical protein
MTDPRPATMMVKLRVPTADDQPLATVLGRLIDAPRGEPFADDVLELCSRFAQRLMADPVARVHPELMTLGFFMRKAELMRMKREFEAGARPDVVRVPHGLVFHVPPANVDAFEAGLAQAGVDGRVLRYDADHAFANPSGARYDEPAATAAWAEVERFLAANLRTRTP